MFGSVEQVKMGEVQANDSSMNCSDKNGFGLHNFTSSGLHSFVTNFQKKVCERVELHFKPWKSDDCGSKLETFTRSNEASSTAELSLEKLLLPWKENPAWVDHPPDIKITLPEGSVCNLNLEVNVGLPPEAVYNLLTDPSNKRVFRHIKDVISRMVLVDDGSRQVVELEQSAIWRFLCFSGTIPVHVLIDQNRQNCTMKYKQMKSGLLRRFEGSWKVEPIFVDEELCHPLRPNSLTDYIMYTKGRGRIASKASLEQFVQLSIAPSALNWYLGGITAKNTGMFIDDLVAEAARIREESSSVTCHLSTDDDETSECEVGDALNIKERWALRRKSSRSCRRRLS